LRGMVGTTLPGPSLFINKYLSCNVLQVRNMQGKIMEGIKKTGRGIFEDVEGLSMVSIYDIHFTYNTNMAGYPTLSSDIRKLGEIESYQKGVVR